MNHDFLQVKTLDGELKISHKKGDTGVIVSTKELVLQRPHINYHLLYEDIVSIVPYEPPVTRKSLTFTNRDWSGSEITRMISTANLYKVFVKKAKIHNRSGFWETKNIEFIMPIQRKMLDVISSYSSLNAIDF